jgi:hypothetical protein
VATKAVTSANAEWDNGNQEEAITQYRDLLPKSTFLFKDEQVKVYRRLIEFDAEHDNAEGARRLIGEADEKNLDLSLTEPRATALLAEYQQEKREKEERRKQEEADKVASNESKADNSSSKLAFLDKRSAYYKEIFMANARTGSALSNRIAWAKANAPNSTVLYLMEDLKKSRNEIYMRVLRTKNENRFNLDNPNIVEMIEQSQAALDGFDWGVANPE